MIRANLIHLSYNMWNDDPKPFADQPDHILHETSYRPYLRFDDALWRHIVERMENLGMTMIILDVGDAVRFESHPEIALPDAWSREKLTQELAFCRKHGLEVIPKFNFSTCHDTWMGDYGRMVSTPAYYQVCRDLINETTELFDRPRFFHIGMDEEEARHQTRYLYACMRQGRLWWHDLQFLVDAVEARGARAMVWADKLWTCGIEEYAANMPKTVVQMNWYYGTYFADQDPTDNQPWFNRRTLEAFDELDARGYEQIPTGSNFTYRENLALLADYCSTRLTPGRLPGYCQTPWQPTTERWRKHHDDALDGCRNVG